MPEKKEEPEKRKEGGVQGLGSSSAAFFSGIAALSSVLTMCVAVPK